MTIIASVKVRDGLVLAADSAINIFGKTPEGRGGVIQTYSMAEKIFELKGFKAGAASYGFGSVGGKSVGAVIADTLSRIENEKVKNMEGLARAIFENIEADYNEALKSEKEKPALGFFIVGYSEGESFGEEWEFLLPRDKEPKSVRGVDACGVSWRGVDIPFTRLFKGFDPRLRKELKEAGLDEDTINGILRKFAMAVIYDGMPLQDAIDFASFIVNTTINQARFEIGPPSCQGPVDVGVVVKEEGFKWIARKQLRVCQ